MASPQSDINGELLFKIAQLHFKKKNYKKAIEFAQQSLANHDTQQINEELALLLLLLGNAYLATTNTSQATETARKALVVSSSIKASQQIATSFLLIGKIHKQKGEFSKAIHNLQKGIREAEKLVDQQLIAQLYNHLSEVYIDLSNFDKALEYSIRALKIAREQNVPSLIRHSRNNMGIAQLHKENLPLAFLNFRESLTIAEKLQNPEAIASDHLNLGCLFASNGESFKALDYFLTAWQQLEKNPHKNKVLLFQILHQMGIVFIQQSHFELAYKKLNQALAISQEIANPLYKANVLQSLGTLHYKQKSFETAYLYFFDANQLFQTINQQRGIGIALNLLANCTKSLQQTEQAFQYASKALSVNEIIDNKKELATSCLILYQLYKDKKSFQQALLYHEKYNQLNEKLINLEKRKELKKLEMQYKMKQKEISIAKLQLQNLQLSEYNIKEIKKFASIASHDLRTPLNHIQSFATLIKERSQELLDEDSLQFLTIIEESSNHMAQLIKELQQYANAGLNEKQSVLINLNNLIDDIQLLLQDIIQKNEVTIHTDSLPAIYCHPPDIQTIFKELITNAIKFRKPDTKPVIKIGVHKEENFYIFSVKDNGIGVAKEYEDKVFELFRKLHTNDQYPGFGTGLPICRKILLNYEGQIWLAPNSQNGACFKFSFPIQQ